MPEIDLSKAREWLTASELRLVESNRGSALTNASAAELRKKIALARTLRDKWRDVYARQRRQVQSDQKSRATAANQRSRQKSALFGQVLTRFEAQLAKVMASPDGSATRNATGRSDTTGRSKGKRTRQHRRERSRVKQTLAGQVAERESAGVRSAQADRPPMQTRTMPAKKKPASASRKKTAASARRASKQAGGTRAPAPRAAAGRRSSKPAAAKARSQSQSAMARHRTSMSGLTTRIRGHVSARGKRAQGRRDRRG